MFPATIGGYERPATIDEALAALAAAGGEEAMFIAGGQSLMQAIKSRLVRPDALVDLQGIAELKGIDTSAGLRIGAMTRYVDIATAALPPAYAALNDAAKHVGDRQVRNRGTIGGSVCWNYVASCMPCVAIGTGATMQLAAAGGKRREVAAQDFLLGPFETAREDNEILLALTWPNPSASTGSAYQKWGLVTDALPVVGVCVQVSVDDGGRCTAATVALAGLADGAQGVAAGGAALTGSDGDSDSLLGAMEATADAVETHDDKWASAAYRRQLIIRIGAQVAARAFARATGTEGSQA